MSESRNQSSMNDFNRIQEVFDILHKEQIEYAILRNYSNLLNDDIYMDGHGDIDLICSDSKKIVAALNAYSNDSQIRDGLGNGTHYFIILKGEKVSLDLRHIGDDYYCEKWQRDMLTTKVWKDGFYVLNDQHHFFSLIYHAILQKPRLSEEYRARLKKMGIAAGIHITSTETPFFMNLLEKYMRDENYNFVYPVDHYVSLRKKVINDRSLLIFNYQRYFEHFLFETKVSLIEIMVKIKHLIFKSNK